jgi:capsular exopolysaccharide synthesis family protein
MADQKPVHVPRDKYPELAYPSAITTVIPDYSDEDTVQLIDYWRVILARRWTVLAILATVVFATLLYTLKKTPVYEATASIQIDRENPNILSFKDVYQVETATDDTLRTQFEILKSRSLARRVIDQVKLNKLKEFQLPEPTLLSTTFSYIKDSFVPKKSTQQDADPLRAIVDAYIEHLDVVPVRQARLVNISFRSTDPELAAQVINVHAKEFIDQNLQFKVEATEAASNFLQQNLATLRQNLEKADDQLQQYSQQNQILFTEEGKNTATEKLRQLQEAYTKAQEDRISRASYSGLIESGKADSLPQITNNKLIEDLTSKMVDLQRQESELAVTFRPEYPTRQRIVGQIDQLRTSIDAEKERIVTSIRSEYSAAAAREELLLAELDKQRQVVNKINEDIIQYNIYKTDAESVRQLYDGLQKRLKEASVSAGLTASNIRIVDLAEIPPNPVSPRKGLNLLLSVVLGLSIGVGIAFLQEYLDSSVKVPEDVGRYLSLPTLGVIPKLGSLGQEGYGYSVYGYRNSSNSLEVTHSQEITAGGPRMDLIVHDHPSSPIAEAYRSLRTSLLLSSPGQPPRVIVVTSAAPSEGKTTTAVNLAASLTQTGSKVVLIDGDMRKPRIQNVFNLPGQSVGLSSFLAGASSLKDVIYKTTIENLWAIPCGFTPPNPGELILSSGFRKMLETLRDYFDFVVLDSPPVGYVSDSRILASTSDATILVVKAFATSRRQAQDAVGHLTNAHAHVRGVVLNDMDMRRRSYYTGHSGYGPYDGYGYRTIRSHDAGNHVE